MKPLTVLLIALWTCTSCVSPGEWTPLHEAARKGDIEKVKVLLSAGANVNARDERGSTPLRWAALWDHTKTVKILLKAGANVNAKTNHHGWTLLHWETYGGETEMVKLLVEAGADVNARTNGRWTPLDLANLGLKEATEFLRSHGAKTGYEIDFPLHGAAGGGMMEHMKALIASGAKLNATDTDGTTPLHKAAEKGRTDTVKLLIKAGAEVNVNMKSGRLAAGGTPLHCAARKGYTKVTKLLLQAGAKVNAEDNDGSMPLQLAAYKGHTETVKVLIEAGAKLNAKIAGWTSLHWAALDGRTKVAKLLLEAEANINARDEDGLTPLNLARKKEMRQFLRKHGAKTGAELDAEAKQNEANKAKQE